MKREETMKMIMVLQQTFPNYHFNLDNLELWINEFANEDYMKTAKAVKEIISTSKFFPTIAEIKQKMNPTKKGFQNYNSSESLTDFDLQILNHTKEKYGKYLDYTFEELKQHFNEVENGRIIN